RTALPRLHVLELDNAPDVAVELDVHPVLELVRVDRLGHRRATLADLDEILADAREVLESVLRNEHVVLDADPPAARKVDSRLDRHDVSGDERVGGFLRHAGSFVNIEPDPMTEPVSEGATERRLFDDVPRPRVRLDTRYAPVNRLQSALLRLRAHAVCLLQLV